MKRNKKLLLVRTDGIGDFIIFSPMLKYYRELFSGYDIHLVVIPLVVSLTQNNPYIDKVIPFDQEINFFGNPIRYIKQMMILRSVYYDKVIYPIYERNRDSVVLLAKGKEKIAFNVHDNNRSKLRRNRMFNTLIDPDPQHKKEIERNEEFIKKVGYKGIIELKTEIWGLEEKKDDFKKFKDEYQLKEKAYVVLAPGARFPIKMWPVEKWVMVVREVLDKTGYKILFSGAGADERVIKNILEITGADDRIIDIANTVDLRFLAKIVKEANFIIGMDSAVIHVAAAVGTPNICLMGGGHFGRFYPYGPIERNRIIFKKMDCFRCAWLCKYKQNTLAAKIRRKVFQLYDDRIGQCVKNIEVDDVMTEVEYILKRIDS
ncbi:MAG: glycosyltransferase family 9 protein [Candidatus Omnitrophica bacterium]|nr:glycosyltransferase family 9 protein [Candidatus Omnitrophota bacterium]